MGALVNDMMTGGTSAGQATAINGLVNTGISAAGTTIGTATDLTRSMNYVSTVASGAGVQLPATMQIGDEVEVYNAGANTLTIYPDQTTVGFNQLSVGTGVSLPINTAMRFKKYTATRIIAFLSA